MVASAAAMHLRKSRLMEVARPKPSADAVGPAFNFSNFFRSSTARPCRSAENRSAAPETHAFQSALSPRSVGLGKHFSKPRASATRQSKIIITAEAIMYVSSRLTQLNPFKERCGISSCDDDHPILQGKSIQQEFVIPQCPDHPPADLIRRPAPAISKVSTKE